MRQDLEIDPVVYALRSVGLVKIGFTQNLTNRLATVRCNSAMIVDVLDYAPGTRGDERRLHQFFRHFRHHGEWFMLRPTQIDDLKEHFEMLRRRT